VAAFPSGKLLASGYQERRLPTVERTEFENGSIKQTRVDSRILVTFPVTYLFTAAEYTAFLSFIITTIDYIGWFEWTDPRTSSILQTRIVGGDISDATPVDASMAYFTVTMVFESFE